MFKITPTSLLTTTAQVLWTIALGVFMLMSVAVIAFKVVDAYETRQRIHQIDIADMGRLHIYDARDHSKSSYGEPVKCWAYVKDGSIKQYYSSSDTAGYHCQGHFAVNIRDWREYQGDNRSSMFLNLVVLALIGAGIFLVVRMVAGIMALVIGTVDEKKLTTISAFLSLPMFFLAIIFLLGMSTNTSKVWTAPGEYPVKVYPVYRSQDGAYYIAPETTYEWTDPKVGTRINP
jgi:hypothetical protein